jgi:hypothetical protein
MDKAGAMSEEAFSISRHVHFLEGYLDAVGRTLSDGAELVSLWCVQPGDTARDPARYARVDTWDAEFDALANDFLRIDARARLGFYLVEYLCWFRDFTQDATCYRGAVCDDPAAPEIVYRIEWPDGHVVQIGARRVSRAVTDGMPSA